MPVQTADDNWEDAYRGLVAELESKERRWTAVESELRFAATQLAIAAMGQSTVLDTVLTRIIELVRDATDPLTGKIEELQQLLRRAEHLDEPSRQRIVANPDHPDRTATVATIESPLDIRSVVSALTSRLATVPDLAAVADRIDKLRGNDDWHSTLINTADSIAQVVSSLNAERAELEQFLGSVTTQLADFEKWAQWHLSDTRERRSDGAALQQSFSDQIENLHAEVESTNDIGQLRSTVQNRLRAVADRFRNFSEKEAQRLSDAEARNAALAGEVSRLRKRTSELSEICGDQQNRLMLDALTGVHSRYAYEERIQQEFQKWSNERKPLTFTLWDIDKFKSINDTYGHDAGDRLLRRVSLIIKRHKRGDDFVARIGGEEFVLLLPGTGSESALAIANRLREAVASTPFNYHGEPQQVTISCGVTEFREGDTPTSVYKRADKALYDAKNAGRNRCVSA